MNKPRKVDFKKTLVRNTVQTVPKCKVIAESGTTSQGSEKAKSETQIDLIKSGVSTKSSTDNLGRPANSSTKKFDSPELYSTLKLSKKIDNIVNPRKTKSCSDVEKKLAVDEKVSRKVNFPYDQPIYKDLISLKSDVTQSQPVISSRTPLPQKDKEPVLSDFVTPRTVKDYYYLPRIKIEQKPMLIGNNNLRLYNILQQYE